MFRGLGDENLSWSGELKYFTDFLYIGFAATLGGGDWWYWSFEVDIILSLVGARTGLIGIGALKDIGITWLTLFWLPIIYSLIFFCVHILYGDPIVFLKSNGYLFMNLKKWSNYLIPYLLMFSLS